MRPARAVYSGPLRAAVVDSLLWPRCAGSVHHIGEQACPPLLRTTASALALEPVTGFRQLSPYMVAMLPADHVQHAICAVNEQECMPG